MKCIKRPTPVQVVFAECNGEIQSLEGRVAYVAGDAIVTGPGGEQWPVRRERFAQTYAPLSGISMGEAGEYSKMALVVEARQVACQTSVTTDTGQLMAKPGDWIVTAPDGARWVVDGDIFTQTYTLLE